MMEESILNTIKDMLGVNKDDFSFDTDIMVHINSALMTLQQYGVGPKDGFRITDASQMWSQFLPDDKKADAAKTYVYLKVKMIFDPPQTSFVMDAYKQEAAEIEYRLKEQIEAYPGDVPDSNAESEEDTHGFSSLSDYYDYLDEQDRREIENAGLFIGGDS